MANLKRYLKYLFVPGLVLTMSGLIAGLTTSNWTPLYLGLLVAGIVIILFWLIFILGGSQGFWGRRSTQAGTNVLLSTVAILVILGLINFLGIRYSTRIDLTENQIFTLSPQTEEIVKNLKQPVKVWVFDKEPSDQDKELLKNYSSSGPNFQYEFIDPDQKPQLAEQFKVKQYGDVYLQYGEKKQLVQSLINFSQKEPLSEIKLTNAIEKIQRDRILGVYFLEGHGELSLKEGKGGLSQAIKGLEDKGFKVEPLNLGKNSAIPQDARVIIIAKPERELLEQEVKTLENYSERGGSLFLMIDPTNNPELEPPFKTGLEPLLKKWGVDLEQRVVIDPSSSIGPVVPIINTYGDHPITKEFKNGNSLYPLARPIATVKKKGVEAVSLLVTNNEMWGENDLASEEISFDPKKDIPGPLDLGVALTRTALSRNK